MHEEVKGMLERMIKKNVIGKKEDKGSFENLVKLNIPFPKELKEIYLNFPIIGIEVQYHYDEPKEDWELYAWEWMSVNEIIEEVTKTSTGEHFLKLGYLPIGMDVLGGGDYYYVDFKKEELPVFQCYHDDLSIEKIAPSIKNIFKYAIIE